MHILLEWQKSKIIKERTGENNFKLSSDNEIGEKLLEKLKNEGIVVEFIGRELFNVLVCNLDQPFCEIEITGISEEKIEKLGEPAS